MDSNAGHLNKSPVHDMVLLLLPSGGNWNYTGWLADRLHWLLLTAALCNGCCCLQLLRSAMAGCYLQWLLLSAMAATVCNGCCFWRLWIHWSGCGSPGFTAGLPVEMCQSSNCSNSCGHGTNKCSIISM